MIDVKYDLRLIEDFIFSNGMKVYCEAAADKNSVVVMHLTHLICPECLFIHNTKSDLSLKSIMILYDYSMKYRILYCRDLEMETIIKGADFLGQISGKQNKLITSPWIRNDVLEIQSLYPILNWTEEKVLEFCNENNLTFNENF